MRPILIATLFFATALAWCVHAASTSEWTMVQHDLAVETVFDLGLTNSVATNVVSLATNAVQRTAGISTTNTWISAASVTNQQAFIAGQLITWTTNGVSL